MTEDIAPTHTTPTVGGYDSRDSLAFVRGCQFRCLVELLHRFDSRPELAFCDGIDGCYLPRPLTGALIESGGAPNEMPQAYLERSPFGHLGSLVHVQVDIAWSPFDTVIPNQSSAHTHLLATQLQHLGGQGEEDIVTHSPAEDTADIGRFAHEACDVREGLGWLTEQLTPPVSVDPPSHMAQVINGGSP